MKADVGIEPLVSVLEHRQRPQRHRRDRTNAVVATDDPTRLRREPGSDDVTFDDDDVMHTTARQCPRHTQAFEPATDDRDRRTHVFDTSKLCFW